MTELVLILPCVCLCAFNIFQFLIFSLKQRENLNLRSDAINSPINVSAHEPVLCVFVCERACVYVLFVICLINSTKQRDYLFNSQRLALQNNTLQYRRNAIPISMACSTNTHIFIGRVYVSRFVVIKTLECTTFITTSQLLLLN